MMKGRIGQWKTTKLGEHVDIQTGFPFKSQKYVDDPSEIRLLRGDNIVQGRLRWEGVKRWPQEDASNFAKYFLQTDDVVLAMDRPWIEAGLKYAWITGRDLPCLLVQRVSRLRGRNGLLTPYIRYVIGHHSFTDYVKGIWTGIAVPHISESQIRAFEFCLPPIATQEKILNILSAYDDLIENNTRRNKILEDMAQVLYREWFVNFRFPGHEKVRMVESELGPIPEDWSVKALGDTAEITMGLSPKGDTYNEEGEGTPLVNGPVEFGERFTRTVKWTTAPSKVCVDGDLIVCVRGSTTGKFVKSNGTYCLGRGVCAMRSQYQCFVDLLFRDELPKLLAQTSGSTFPSWTGPQLKSHPVICPSRDCLERFEAVVRPITTAVLNHSRRIENLRTTRDLLLPKLISGEVPVESADDAAAELMEQTA